MGSVIRRGSSLRRWRSRDCPEPFHFRSSGNFSTWIESPYRVFVFGRTPRQLFFEEPGSFLDGHSGNWSYDFRSTSIRKSNHFHVDMLVLSTIPSLKQECCQAYHTAKRYPVGAGSMMAVWVI